VLYLIPTITLTKGNKMNDIYFKDMENKLTFFDFANGISGWDIYFDKENKKYRVTDNSYIENYDGGDSHDYDYGNFETHKEAVMFILLVGRGIITAMDRENDPAYG
tara:strand:- start:41 stop:358 length:318 start_codon:yes stop_codon:yes gene_type:complete